MEISNLIFAATGFTLIHFLSITNLRATVVGKFGVGAWAGPFALTSLGFFSWMIYEFIYIEVTRDFWYVPDWYLWVHVFIMLIIMFLMVFGGMKTNRIGGGLKAITRHPTNWGTSIFAASHMVVNSSVESLIFFGSLLAVGIVGTFLLDRRKTREGDAKWLELVAVTSWVPFLAILQGRNKLSAADFKWWHFAVVIVVWLVIMEIHRGFFGKYILPL